jgi:ABC-2 type transport system ATP-binding protein
VLHQSIETLSKGFRHRTCFAQSIIHDPPILVLDEPTDGLDPNQKHEVRTLIRTMGRTKAIVFSTHILEEVEAACSRAIIIDRGQIVANGTPDELKQRSEHAGAVTVRLLDGSSAEVMQRLNQLPMVGKCTVLSESPVTVRAYLKKNGQRGELARAIGDLAAAERWRIEELHTEEGRLDEVFRNITRPETKQEEAA